MLRHQEGIQSDKVTLLAEHGVVKFDPEKWTVERVIKVCCHWEYARMLTDQPAAGNQGHCFDATEICLAGDDSITL